ncbi:hypothetical protein CD30_13035 [Ureibacillus massiliensis 4400831 = CIP 108448 = CCUG 49529]|uniref:Uncharacterized protein n=1 Tax=Ureibacillus massiliensis 4400831 = CIP 108448 = CCUG 49529 TaxID=1211035 RepID=A0A0A3J394_9BACL|nr:hypothetical protein [Ureibacillus massiliensis]KGR90170.1 hypothetical protein CD30_13035 [Ureibacillus massiliensis 4400831 = CIP 108448 = CCUG 49529]
MNSRQKLSQVKRFAKSKVKEFHQLIPSEIHNVIDWSNINLHMDNYTYSNDGMQLISVLYDEKLVSDPEQLQDQLEEISIQHKLGMYVTVDEEMGMIYFFNKALNNHIRVYRLMAYDEDNFVQHWMKRLPFIDSNKLTDILSLLKELKFTSDDVFVQLTMEENNDFVDNTTLEGIIKKVTDKEVILESVGEAKFETVVKVSEEWKLTKTDHWQRQYQDILIEL